MTSQNDASDDGSTRTEDAADQRADVGAAADSDDTQSDSTTEEASDQRDDANVAIDSSDALSTTDTVSPDVAGTTPQALLFDGTSDLVRTIRLVDGDFTLEAWIKTTKTGVGSNFFNAVPIFYSEVPGPQNDYEAGVLNNCFAFGTGNPDTTIQSTTQITTGAWIHVAAVRVQASGTIRVVVNGVQEATLSGLNMATLNASGAMVLGNGPGSSPFAGELDEVRVWNVARTTTDIAANRGHLLKGDESGLVAYFRFDETGNVVHDWSNHGNDAPLGSGFGDGAPLRVPSDAPLTAGP